MRCWAHQCGIVKEDAEFSVSEKCGWMLHINVQSLSARSKEFEIMIESTGFPDVVALTEIWLPESNNQLYSIGKLYPCTQMEKQ